MAQYVAFVEYFEPKKWSMEILLSSFRILKFIDFYDALDKAPNSIANKAKCLLVVNILIFF